jgi:hypothetical protein
LRGVPNNPVLCRSCNKLNGSPADQLCHGCRVKTRPSPNKRFFWTPEFDQQLRLCYLEAPNKVALTENLTGLQKRTGFTRVVLLARAAHLGLSAQSRPWTPGEIQSLENLAGTFSSSAIARKLGRSYGSIKARCAKQNISRRISDGYSREDVESLLGVGARSVRKWIKSGWLKLHQDRVTESSMIRFLREHPEEYRLNRVDETWFKGLLFPSFGRNYVPSPGDSPKRPSSNAAACIA